MINVPKEKIREVIGTGGKVIREIVEVRPAPRSIIEDDGTIKIAATTEEAAQKAIDWIRGIVAEPEVGVIYTWQGGQDRRFRRVRELPRVARRAGAYQRIDTRAA